MTESVEDLSARVRRGELDEPEQRRLQQLLDASLEARLLHRAGCELDAESSVRRGDEALSERITRRVLLRVREGRVPTQPRSLRWTMVLAAAFVTAVATAGTMVGLRSLAPGPTAPAKSSVVGSLHSKSASAPREASARTELRQHEDVAAPATPVAKASQPPRADGPRGSGRGSSSSSAHASAADLFAAAASARRQSQFADAIVLYDELQSRYPASAEANAADIALGMLRLQRGSASSALDHFQRYLKRSPAGELAPEALWGSAQALSNLGRLDEARSNFAQLVERYPESAYAAAARAKLASSKPAP